MKPLCTSHCNESNKRTIKEVKQTCLVRSVFGFVRLRFGLVDEARGLKDTLGRIVPPGSEPSSGKRQDSRYRKVIESPPYAVFREGSAKTRARRETELSLAGLIAEVHSCAKPKQLNN